MSAAEVHEPPAHMCWMFGDDTTEELVEGDHAGAGAKPRFAPWGPAWKSNFTGASWNRLRYFSRHDGILLVAVMSVPTPRASGASLPEMT